MPSDITRTYAAAPGALRRPHRRARTRPSCGCARRSSRASDYREVHLSAHRILGDVLHEIGLTTLPGQARPGAGRDRACSSRMASAICWGCRCTMWAASWAMSTGRRAQASGRASVPAADAHARAGRGGDGRARHLSDRFVARGRARGQAPRAHRLGRGRSSSGRTAASGSRTTWWPRPRRPENMTRDAFAELAA